MGSRHFLWAGASLSAMAAGAFGPWATALGSITIGGTDGPRDGWVVLGAAIVAGASLLVLRRRGRWPVAISLVAGCVAAATTAYDISDIATINSAMGDGFVDLAWGIYVALAGSISLMLASGAQLLGRRQHDDGSRSEPWNGRKETVPPLAPNFHTRYRRG